jgi:hypothetical protein
MHAIGVIAVNYNRLESSLFNLFAHHLIANGTTYRHCEYLFWSYDNARRTATIEFLFREHEKEPAVKEHIEHFLKYWSVVSEKRHLLMHSWLDASPENELLAGILDPKQAIMRLAKLSKDDWSTELVMRLSLPNLQAIADQLNGGVVYATEIANYLLSRDYQAFLKGFLKHGSLPEKPRLPRKLKVRQRLRGQAAEPHQPAPSLRSPLLEMLDIPPSPPKREEGGI